MKMNNSNKLYRVFGIIDCYYQSTIYSKNVPMAMISCFFLVIL